MVRLVEQHGGPGPGALLIAPVVELAGDHGIHIGPDASIAQHVHRVAGDLQQTIEILLTHDGDVLWYLIRLLLRCDRAPATGTCRCTPRAAPQPPHARYAQPGAAPGRRS